MFTICYVYESIHYPITYSINRETKQLTFTSRYDSTSVFCSDIDPESMDDLFMNYHDHLLPDELVEECEIFFSLLASKLFALILQGECDIPRRMLTFDLDTFILSSGDQGLTFPNTESESKDVDFIDNLRKLGIFDE